MWIAKRRDPGEFIGIRLEEPKEVQCVKIKQMDKAHGVRWAALEKGTEGMQCAGYARVAEFPDFVKSYDELYTFNFHLLSTKPDGVFQIRSRHDIGRCIGVKAPDDQLEDISYGLPQRSFESGADLELQVCSIRSLTQFWYMDGSGDSGRLTNVWNTVMTMKIPAAEAQGDPAVPGSPTSGGSVVAQQCTDDCPNDNSLVKFNKDATNDDGFLIHAASGNFILGPENMALEPAVGSSDNPKIVSVQCGDAGDTSSMVECADKSHAQFDLLPLFTILEGRQAINCAPYSHTHPDALQPIGGLTHPEVQRICAQDTTCKVYMYVDPSAPDPNGGASNPDAGKAWFCTGLDVVYSGVTGYSLGFRALDDNEEEELYKAEQLRSREL